MENNINKEELRKELVELCTNIVNDTDEANDSMGTLIAINVESITDHKLLDTIQEIMKEEEVVGDVMMLIQLKTCIALLDAMEL